MIKNNSHSTQFILRIKYPYYPNNSYLIVRDLINKSLQGLIDIYIIDSSFIEFEDEHDEDEYDEYFSYIELVINSTKESFDILLQRLLEENFRKINNGQNSVIFLLYVPTLSNLLAYQDTQHKQLNLWQNQQKPVIPNFQNSETLMDKQIQKKILSISDEFYPFYEKYNPKDHQKWLDLQYQKNVAGQQEEEQSDQRECFSEMGPSTKQIQKYFNKKQEFYEDNAANQEQLDLDFIQQEEALQKKLYKGLTGQNIENLPLCGICHNYLFNLSKQQMKQIKKLKCGHEFHKLCYIEYFKVEENNQYLIQNPIHKCPICRAIQQYF